MFSASQDIKELINKDGSKTYLPGKVVYEVEGKVVDADTFAREVEKYKDSLKKQ
jgi:hypothetical protein